MVIGQSVFVLQLQFQEWQFEQVPPLVPLGQSAFVLQVTLLFVEQVPMGLTHGLLVLHKTLLPYVQ
ncbi:MAG: hypothetical protein ABSF35_11400 [Polyangia bacterium]|jgi:hypothetical protein